MQQRAFKHLTTIVPLLCMFNYFVNCFCAFYSLSLLAPSPLTRILSCKQKYARDKKEEAVSVPSLHTPFISQPCRGTLTRWTFVGCFYIFIFVRFCRVLDLPRVLETKISIGVTKKLRHFQFLCSFIRFICAPVRDSLFFVDYFRRFIYYFWFDVFILSLPCFWCPFELC